MRDLRPAWWLTLGLMACAPAVVPDDTDGDDTGADESDEPVDSDVKLPQPADREIDLSQANTFRGKFVAGSEEIGPSFQDGLLYAIDEAPDGRKYRSFAGTKDFALSEFPQLKTQLEAAAAKQDPPATVPSTLSVEVRVTVPSAPVKLNPGTVSCLPSTNTLAVSVRVFSKERPDFLGIGLSTVYLKESDGSCDVIIDRLDVDAMELTVNKIPVRTPSIQGASVAGSLEAFTVRMYLKEGTAPTSADGFVDPGAGG